MVQAIQMKRKGIREREREKERKERKRRERKERKRERLTTHGLSVK